MLFPFKIRGNPCNLITIQTKMLHTCNMSSFLSKFDFIISKTEAKTESSDFSFVKLYIKKYLHETETTDELNEMHIHSLPAGGA